MNDKIETHEKTSLNAFLENNLLSIKEGARLLLTTKAAIRQAIFVKRIPAKKIKNQWFVEWKDLEEFKKTKHYRDLSRYNGELVFDKNKDEYSVKEAAKLLNEPDQQIYYACRKKRINTSRKGTYWVIKMDDIMEYKRILELQRTIFAVKEKRRISKVN